MSPDTPHPFSERYDPGPIGRWSLQMQAPSAESDTSPTDPMDLGAKETCFEYISPPAPTTTNYSGFAGTGYRKSILLHIIPS